MRGRRGAFSIAVIAAVVLGGTSSCRRGPARRDPEPPASATPSVASTGAAPPASGASSAVHEESDAGAADFEIDPTRDVDVAHVMSAVHCTASSTSPGCKVLRDFQSAERWEPPKEEELWFGTGHAIGGTADGETHSFFTRVQCRIGGCAYLGNTIKTPTPALVADARTLLVATKEGAFAPADSEIAKQIRAYAPVVRRPMRPTTGMSLRALEGTPTFLRKQGDRLLLLEYTGRKIASPGSTHHADAWAIELWKLRAR